MLVATGLLTSTLGTWAQSTGSADVKMTYVDYNNAATAMGEIASGETARTGYNKIEAGTVGWGYAKWNINYITYIQVDASKIEGKVTNATLSLQVSGATDSKRNGIYGVGFNPTDWSSTMTYTSADKSITTLGNTATTSTQNATTFETKTFDITDAFKNDEDKIVTILVYAANAAGGYVKNPTATITTAAASSMTSYNVKYVNEQGEEIKTTKSYDVAIGDDATARSEEMASFFKDSKKYIYKSGNTTIKAVEDATQNVITLVFREAETWNYTINCIAGNTTKQIKGSALEGESFNIAYPYALNVNGTLYTTGKHSKDRKGYYLDFSLSENNKSQDITYSATDTKNVIYFSEAENIDGLTVITTGNTAIRSSNGSSAYAKDNNVEITKLPAGAYKLHACFYDATKDMGTIWNFLAGYKNIFTFTTSAPNWQEGDSELFTINKDTPIYLAQGGSSAKAVDFLYIQKVADVATISSAEYATYVTTSAVKVPENVKVFTVKANETGIETKEVAASTVLAAGTPVLLNAAAADYTFELSDEAGTKPADNDLNAATSSITADGTQYCLTQNDEGKVGFAKVQAGLNIPTGKAYLVVKNNQTSNFFALDGSVTAIKNVNAAQNADGAYYTLQGVKVENPSKGIYIKNGKKVVIK